MDSFRSDPESDFVPSTPDYPKTKMLAAFSEYRTPQLTSNISSSFEETDKSLASHTSANFTDSHVDVVEESDLEGTPVAISKNKQNHISLSPKGSLQDSFYKDTPFDEGSKENSPIMGRRKALRNVIESSVETSNHFDEQSGSSVENSPFKELESDVDVSPIPALKPQQMEKKSSHQAIHSTEDSVSSITRRESDSPIQVRKNTARKIIDSDESDNETGPEQNESIDKRQEAEVEDVFEESARNEIPEHPVSIEKNTQAATSSHRKAPEAVDDDIQEVEIVPSKSKNISTISLDSTSSEFSDDDQTGKKTPQTPPSAEQSIQEIPSPSENIPPLQDVSRVLSEIRRSLDNKRSLLRSVNPRLLPDGGAKIKSQIQQLEEELAKAERLHASQASRSAPVAAKPTQPPMTQQQAELLRQQMQMKKWALGSATGDQRAKLRSDIADMERQLNEMALSSLKTYRIPLVNKEPAVKLLPEAEKLSEIRRMYADQPTDRELYTKGRQTAAQKREAVSVTLEALQNLHNSLATCPSERDTEPTPEALAVPLLPHQTRALKWLLWRENQVPAGGVLADDMGLGKTLTMISLIVRQRELGGSAEVSDVWLTKELKIKKTNSTLIVCPASVIGQWENEILRRTKRNTLSVLIYHGPDRHRLASKLYKSDVVLTTYQIITREISNIAVGKDDDMGPIGDFNEETHAKEIRQSPLLQVAWDRIVLDEAHTIRNPKAQVSQAVCRLRAARRWVVTGTPVQNKELDMYSLLRFLRVSPFDQLAVWKRWVDCKSAQGTERLNLLVKTLLLRRTKDQKMEDTGAPLVKMPARQMHTHQIKLSKEENEVYQKILDFSRRALEQYIKSQEKKAHDDWKYDPKSRKSEERSNAPKDMTKHHLLVLLLRLRQACSHPALIKTMLEATESESIGSDAKIDESDDLDLISQMASMNIDGNKSGQEKEEEKNFFSLSNPIFQASNCSSKMKNVIEEVQRIVTNGQKVVIVSQWTSMLDVFDVHFQRLHIRCHRIAGNVNVKQRTAFVEDFNTNPKGPPVMLLSLAAGGVGLNLIGGNHLFLTDMHWNPQLEAQACDRVYRVGQLKDVHVHRFVTVGTVEERITELQKRKLELASGILTGAQNVAAKGLTLEDLKMLFNPSPASRFTLSSTSDG